MKIKISLFSFSMAIICCSLASVTVLMPPAVAASSTAPSLQTTVPNQLIKGWQPPSNTIGMNLSILAPIYPETPFVDVFKEATPWIIEAQQPQDKVL